MGLDMYAFAVEKTDLNEQFEVSEAAERQELAYWRKFNALHGWMESFARSEGFDGEFNCVPVQLSPAVIDRLEVDLKAGLKPVEGFFFGPQTVYPEDVEATEKFIADAREAFADGKDVYYNSWW